MAEVSTRRRYTLAILLAVYTCNFMDRQILAILKPAIKHDLGLSDTQLGLLSGLAFTLFYATLWEVASREMRELLKQTL